MGAIEDVRQLFQDLLAPNLKAINVEMREVKERIERIEHHLDDIAAQSRRQHDETLAAVQQVINFAEVKQRLSELERRLPEPPSH